jgi:hypothetical protein
MTALSSSTTSRRIRLDARQLLVLDASRAMQVRVVLGDVWLTQEGALDDHFLRDGESVTLRAPRRTVIESFGSATLEIEERAAARGWLDWRGWMQALRAPATRLAAA